MRTYVSPVTGEVVPSVTAVIGSILRNEALERWRTEQILLAAAPYLRGASEIALPDYIRDQYKSWEAEAMSEAEAAAMRGTQIHEAIEAVIIGEPPAWTRTVEPELSTFLAWRAEHVTTYYGSEIEVFGELNSRRYAGRLDQLVELRAGTRYKIGRSMLELSHPTRAVVDTKVSSAWRPHWELQLAAYALAVDPVNTPAGFVLRLAGDKVFLNRIDVQRGGAAFAGLLEAWYWRNR